MDKQPFFNSLTAWFAKSVSPRRKTLWVKHGGSVVDVSSAQFIFSQDLDKSDMLSLFQSEGYLSGCLTVFHASYIDACIKNQSAYQTPVGNFLLLPKDIHKEGRLPKGDPKQSNTSATHTTQAVQSTSCSISSATQTGNGENYLQEGEDVNHRVDNSDRLEDVPTASRLANESNGVHKKSFTYEAERREARGNQTGQERPDKRKACSRNESDTGTSRFQDIDISKVPHVRDLPKLMGPIVDFIIRKNGCGVQKKTSKK